jgi:hypothetical protein
MVASVTPPENAAKRDPRARTTQWQDDLHHWLSCITVVTADDQ